MIRLITLNNPRVGQAFIDYMATQHIHIEMRLSQSNTYELWLMDDFHAADVETELKAFLADPSNNKYQQASWALNSSRKPIFQYPSTNFSTLVKRKAGWFTLSIIAFGTLLYLTQILGFFDPVFSLLHFPATVDQQWQLWRWVSHALLHFSVLHIVFNMLWWWQLGGDIEKRLGAGKLISLFVLSSACSGLAQFWVEGANFGGLSGVVYALVGYTWILGWKCPHTGLAIQKSVLGFLLIWLVLGFVQPFMAIANSAHLSGLVVGMIFGRLDAYRYRE